MKYLFLDAEWHHVNMKRNLPNCEMLEISGVETTGGVRESIEYSGMIYPKHFNAVSEDTYEFLRINQDELMRADTEDKVLEEFLSIFKEYTVIVVWNRKAYDVFKWSVRKYNLTIRRHRVIVLQEFLMLLDIGVQGRKISFETALNRYNVRYDGHTMHRAENDVQYLRKLFVSVKFQYKLQCEIAPISSVFIVNNYKLIVNKEGHKLYTTDFIREGNIIEILDGMEICLHCIEGGRIPMLPNDLILENLAEDKYCEEKIERLCREYKMECTFCDKLIILRTNVASWRIYHDGRKITNIFHENYRKSINQADFDVKYNVKNRSKKRNAGYHRQNVDIENFYEAIRYIHKHDKYFFSEKLKKKNKIDMLFTMIERDNDKMNMESDNRVNWVLEAEMFKIE